MADAMRHEFKKWDSDNDVIVKNENTLLPKTHPVIVEHTPWAYVLNTAVGFFFMDGYEVTERDVIGVRNGEEIAFISKRRITALNFTDLSGTKRLFDDVTVWAHDFFDDFMIVR